MVTGSSTHDGWADVHMVKVGLQYYISGRYAARAGLLPVAGNLLHHAVEMVLKAQLLKLHSLKEIKSKYAHKLALTWNDFKKSVPSEHLDQFDQAVADLDVFDRIRYPDEIVAKGASMAISWGSQKPAVTTSATEPQYFLYVKDVDDLVHAAFRASDWNPKFFEFTWVSNPEAKRALKYDNAHAAIFLGEA
jgi:hypothetical protein